ncbi:hypothetical protein A2U01_0026740, partial [Trifolium medium]|nr:hypothetical protein [Trifolium medium]
MLAQAFSQVNRSTEKSKKKQRASGSSNETTSKKMKTTITALTDEEVNEPEVPLQRKKSTADVGTHTTKEGTQASGSHVEEKKDRKRKDKKKEKSHTTDVNSGDKSESKKTKKHKKKKSKSSEEKTAPTPSIQPSVETEIKKKEDMHPDTVLQEPQQEILGQPIDESSQQNLNQKLESANSCMDGFSAK